MATDANSHQTSTPPELNGAVQRLKCNSRLKTLETDASQISQNLFGAQIVRIAKICAISKMRGIASAEWHLALCQLRTDVGIYEVSVIQYGLGFLTLGGGYRITWLAGLGDREIAIQIEEKSTTVRSPATRIKRVRLGDICHHALVGRQTTAKHRCNDCSVTVIRYCFRGFCISHSVVAGIASRHTATENAYCSDRSCYRPYANGKPH